MLFQLLNAISIIEFIIIIFFAHKTYSRSFITLRLNNDVTLPILMLFLLPFLALNTLVVLLSIQGQRALGFHQKYLILCSEDK